jgi:hypothetical protein
LLLAIAIQLLGGRAQASSSTGGTTSSTSLTESDFTIYVEVKNADGGWDKLSTDDTKTFFNSARCNCGSIVHFVVETTATSTLSTLTNNSDADGDARLYLSQSNQCTSDPTDSTYDCQKIDEIDDLSSLIKTGYWTSTEISVTTLFGGSTADDCALLETQYIWLWIDTASDGSADLTGDSAPSLSLRLDGKVPAAPTDLSVQGGKEALILSWTASSTYSASSSDLAGYLVFCERSTGSVVFSTSPYDSQFVSPETLSVKALCPNEDTLASSSSSYFATTFANLDVSYLCSGLIGADQTSYRQKGLENDVEYTLVLVAVDKDGNLSAPTDPITGTPVLTVDFYNEYVNEGGQPAGGYCDMIRGAARPGALACLLLGIIIVYTRTRRKRGGKWLWLIPLVGILGARPALGQAVYHDEDTMGMFSEEFSPIDLGPRGQSPRTMAMEFRIGPYHPNIDSGLSNGATPHKTMFGTSTRLLYTLEVDYEILQRFGTLSVGATIGIFQESGKAFVGTHDGLSTGVASSDDTGLRLIPFSLLAVYRMDVMAEQWNVPFVPYVKLGLNYTFWKITDGNGDVATLTQGGRGAGGTAGWQVTGGLALQLDVIDPASMRELDSESGLNHMYLFFEYSHIDASGLGMSNRLHVGDDTWSVGLLMEF